MLELFKTYDLSQILTFIILLAIAVKEIVTFIDWAKERLGIMFGKETKKEKDKELIYNKIQKLETQEQQLQKILAEVCNKIDMLISSDKDDIKSFITEKHHYFCYKQKWIDDYSLDCIEKRFKHYTDEGGNSFIEGLMTELRNLKRTPPQ